MHERQILSEGKMSNLIDVLRKEIKEHELKPYDQELQQTKQKIQQYEQELQQSKQEHQALLQLLNCFSLRARWQKILRNLLGCRFKKFNNSWLRLKIYLS